MQSYSSPLALLLTSSMAMFVFEVTSLIMDPGPAPPTLAGEATDNVELLVEGLARDLRILRLKQSGKIHSCECYISKCSCKQVKFHQRNDLNFISPIQLNSAFKKRKVDSW